MSSRLMLVGMIVALTASRSHADDASSQVPYSPTAAGAATAPTAAAAAAFGISPGPRADTGLVVGSWIVHPSVFAGGVYNDNVYQTNAITEALGVRLDPDLEADLDNGLLKTSIYLNGDAQLYPDRNSKSSETASTVSIRTGVAQVWQPMADLSMRFVLDYSRQDNPFGSGLVTNSTIGSATSFVNSGFAPNFNSFRQFTDTTTGSLSIEKQITNQWFVRAGLGVQDIAYEATNGPASPPDGLDYNAFVRTGFWVTPRLNAFVEVGGDLRRYQLGSANTDSNRIVAGISTEMIGLFRGEAYAGFQRQASAKSDLGAVTAPAYGVTLYYYPTRYLTLAATINDSFGSAGPPDTLSPTSSTVPTNRVIQALVEADYSLASYWTASVRGGYTDTRYSDVSRLDSAWTAGVGFSYTFWRNTAVTLDDQFIRTTTNMTNIPTYVQNVATLGVTYHY